MPLKAVAGSQQLDSGSAVVEGEVEDSSAVASNGVGRCYRIDRGVSIGGAVPDVAIAGGNAFGARSAVVDGQLQSDRAVAAHCIGGGIGGCVGRGGVVGAMPGVAVASRC